MGRVAGSSAKPSLRSDSSSCVYVRTAPLPFVVLLSVFLAALLVACGGKVRPPAETRLTVQVVAANEVNPDSSGRPSPVAVTLLQLKSADAFLNADFFSASDPSGPALAADVLGREEITLRPGETREWLVKVEAATAHIGVIAAFRDLEHASWRTQLPLPMPPEAASGPVDVRLTIRVDARKVSIAPGTP